MWVIHHSECWSCLKYPIDQLVWIRIVHQYPRTAMNLVHVQSILIVSMRTCGAIISISMCYHDFTAVLPDLATHCNTSSNQDLEPSIWYMSYNIYLIPGLGYVENSIRQNELIVVHNHLWEDIIFCSLRIRISLHSFGDHNSKYARQKAMGEYNRVVAWVLLWSLVLYIIAWLDNRSMLLLIWYLFSLVQDNIAYH